MIKDLGVNLSVPRYTDAAAAKGIAHRTGLGKVRHLETCQLWLQHKVSNGSIKVSKIPGQSNLADALTKHLEGSGIKDHLQRLNHKIMTTKHPLALKA